MLIIANKSGRIAISQADMHHPTQAKIESFSRLDARWCYGEGAAFNNFTISSAIRIHEHALLYGFPATDAFPGTNGEIRVTVYPNDRRYLEFTIEPNQTITYIIEEDDQEIECLERLTLEQAIQKLRDEQEPECGWPDYYTPNTTIVEGADSRAWRSETPRVGVYRSSTENALKNEGRPFAPTLEYITLKLRGNRRSFGNSISKTCRTNAA